MRKNETRQWLQIVYTANLALEHQMHRIKLNTMNNGECYPINHNLRSFEYQCIGVLPQRVAKKRPPSKH